MQPSCEQSSTVKFTFSKPASVSLCACVCVCVRTKQFLGIRILITGSTLSSLGSKRRPSRWQWASRYILLFDGVRAGGGGEQEIIGEQRDTTEWKER